MLAARRRGEYIDPVERLLGRYALGQKIASGGMATVHLGHVVGAIGFKRIVAIKRLHERFATDPKFVSMFIDEARLAARVRHPNVVPTLDVVVDDGEIFVILEYVHGEPVHRLSRMVMTAARFPLRIASGILFGVLLGLHAAHDARNERGEPLRIVHRDVSPQNILVGPDGVPRVLDFGVAKAFGRMRTTAQREVKGKLAYLAPEQLTGAPVDQRTDVYGASIILWELITGGRLFHADEPAAILQKAMYATIDPPSVHTGEPNPKLDAIVMRGLARDPSHRWPTARAMALALEECIPPASAPHIGAWVARVARKQLEEREALIAEMEGAVAPVGLEAVLREIHASAVPDTSDEFSDDESTERDALADPFARPK
jgi:eukaryotic-like serine/threonine-protein kinase